VAEHNATRHTRAWDEPSRDFEHFFEHQYGSLLALAIGLSASSAEAEEHVQDAFAIAYRSWLNVQFLDSPGGWTRRVLLNRLASAHRRSQSERRGVLRLASPVAAEDVHTDAELWAAVRELPVRQAQAVALHYIEDLSVKEIAELLDIGPSSVKIHLRRARAALERSLRNRSGT
jgi:RNA polymerase sigma-70 factor (ECF subfamily)